MIEDLTSYTDPTTNHIHAAKQRPQNGEGSPHIVSLCGQPKPDGLVHEGLPITRYDTVTCPKCQAELEPRFNYRFGEYVKAPASPANANHMHDGLTKRETIAAQIVAALITSSEGYTRHQAPGDYQHAVALAVTIADDLLGTLLATAPGDIPRDMG